MEYVHGNQNNNNQYINNNNNNNNNNNDNDNDNEIINNDNNNNNNNDNNDSYALGDDDEDGFDPSIPPSDKANHQRNQSIRTLNRLKHLYSNQSLPQSLLPDALSTVCGLCVLFVLNCIFFVCVLCF